MGPDNFRKSLGFVALVAAPCALFSATPALAQGMALSQFMNTAPFAVALGAGAFGVLAILVLRAKMKEAEDHRSRASAHVATLRALVDQYEGLLAGTNEVAVFWAGQGTEPRIVGRAAGLLPPGRPAETLLSFGGWLAEGDAQRLAEALDGLRVDGRTFDVGLSTRDGQMLRASGAIIGVGAALRLRPVTGEAPATPRDTARALLDSWPDPAVLRDATGRIVFANPAYHMLARRAGKRSSDAEPAHLIGPRGAKTVTVGETGRFAIVECAVGDGVAALVLRPEPVPLPALSRPELPTDESGSHLATAIDALSAPVAIFDARRELVQFNGAYAELWGLDPSWLRPGLEEKTILDRLRTEGKLPSEADYHAWRAKHLNTSYSLKAPRDSDPWHLPDGRTLNVIAAPASPAGGVIYVFEDITRKLELESRNKALLDVQRSTINSLTEAVAVFGTNGRLTLSNPRLSAIWKLPMNELGNSPHIDQVAAAAAKALPLDGAAIWRDLKRAIIDLSPHRTDTSGRITRGDGRLLDYTVVRLPDGQTMMTFLDVTESAKYSQVLREKNAALETADRLKDAFVQNVSYELRSPLTNIIGFADLLSSDGIGPLNERQRAYTDYIRASSVTLGVLIDNILDLATVDAGIAELRPEQLDVAALVEKARAGLAATFAPVDGEKPLNVIIEVPDHLPPLVADGTRVVQVLYNLLSSAARFSEPGATIRLSAASRGERMIFVVEDEGTAITEDLQAALERGADTQPGRQRGAGLGLAIVRAFVSLHGGTITVDKRKPRGNRVTVSLPREVAAVGIA